VNGAVAFSETDDVLSRERDRERERERRRDGEVTHRVGLRQGGYIFYAGASLAGAGYCVKISAQRLPRVAQFYAC